MGWIPEPSSEPAGEGEAEPYTIVLIPDTQYLSETAAWTPHFQALADWIVANETDRNIQLVLHLGDVVDNGNTTEYDRAETPMDTIWDTAIPFAACIGNHDYDGGAPAADRSDTVNWNAYFGTGKYTGRSWWDGEFKDPGQSENFYFRLMLGGRPTLVLVLEFFPTAAAMTWAEGIIEDNALHDVIVLTHAYLFRDGTRTEDGTQHGPNTYAITDFTSGEDMWQDHLRQYHNVVGVFNGHHIGGANTAELSEYADDGNLVFQQFTNWQEEDQGGDGRIVILTVNPESGWATREVYNARNDAFEASHELTFRLFGQQEEVGGSDNDAIHDNVAAEIQAITEKATPADADLVLIEDSEASYAKKSVQVGNLPGGVAAGRYEVVVDGSGASLEPVTNEDEDDWVYGFVND